MAKTKVELFEAGKEFARRLFELGVKMVCDLAETKELCEHEGRPDYWPEYVEELEATTGIGLTVEEADRMVAEFKKIRSAEDQND